MHLSICHFTSKNAASWRRGAALSHNRGTRKPYPPSMAGRIEDAAGVWILRGNVGGERRPRSPCIDGEGGQVMRALRKSNPRITGVRCWLPVVSVGTATLFGALIAGGRHTPGWARCPRREAPAEARHTWNPQEYRAEAHRVCGQALCAFAAPSFLESRAVTSAASSSSTATDEQAATGMKQHD